MVPVAKCFVVKLRCGMAGVMSRGFLLALRLVVKALERDIMFVCWLEGGSKGVEVGI